jgi:hypothetical protein
MSTPEPSDDYPAIAGGNVTFKKARRTAEDQGEQLSL